MYLTSSFNQKAIDTDANTSRADMVKEACAGLGTDDEQLIIILCCRTKAQLERIDQAYRAKYKKTLWEKVRICYM